MNLTKSPIDNRKFGIYMSIFLVILGIWSYFKGLHNLLFFSIVGACVSLMAAIFASTTLAIPNKLWFALGELLGKVTSPIILGAIFFGVFTPVGVLTRAFGRDALCLNKNSQKTYWKIRKEVSGAPVSFHNQF